MSEGESPLQCRYINNVTAISENEWRHRLTEEMFNKEPEGLGFPGGAVVENLPANAGDTGSSPGLGRSHMPWSN